MIRIESVSYALKWMDEEKLWSLKKTKYCHSSKNEKCQNGIK